MILVLILFTAQVWWHCGEKAGYSGTAVLVREGIEVVGKIIFGLPSTGWNDKEGRVCTIVLSDVVLVAA